MKLIRESVSLLFNGSPLDDKSEIEIGQFLEQCGRICYKSEEKISPESYKKFLSMIIASGHHSILEHINISAKIITNRGVTHELVRHRLGAYSQESTRYCNYSSNRFGNELTFIVPVWISDEKIESLYKDLVLKYNFAAEVSSDTDPDMVWFLSVMENENSYVKLLKYGYTPEKAREILPNSLATTIMVTYNLRQWIHVLNQRLSPQCHPQMRQLMTLIKSEFLDKLPLFFGIIDE